MAPSECYRHNLAALAEFQPDVALAVETAPIPDGVAYATGRDGSRTFLIPESAKPADRPGWFGQSSMPTISAAEAFAGFLSDGANVTLPGVLTGLEPLVIAGKMPAHSAVFVAEPSTTHLKLAMHLYDYTALLAAGKLVFALCEGGSPAECLTSFFGQHPGYELPTFLLPVPQRSAAEIADLQRRLEQAGEVVLGMQARMMSSYVERLRKQQVVSLPSAPSVAVLSIDPQPASLEQVRRIGRALTKLGWPHELCAPDAPDKCHVLARLRAIENVAANLVLFVNGGADRLCPLLPDGLPVASWYCPGATVQLMRTGAADRGHLVFAASRELHTALVDAGVPAEMIERCPPGTDDTVYRPVEVPRQQTDLHRVDVAVLMNLPDDRPEACNVRLPSHVALWRSLQDAVRQNVDRYRDAIAEELLDEAQRDSGTTLADSNVREHFLGLVRTRIAPATIARLTVETLIAGKYDVAVWGYNWPSIGCGPEIRRGAIPTGEALNKLFNAAGVVLLVDMSPLNVQAALDALAAGAAVVCRAADEPFEQVYPELADVAPRIYFYRSLPALVDAVSRLTSRPRRRSRESEAARITITSKHSVAQRLQFIVDRILRREAHAAARSGTDVVGL